MKLSAAMGIVGIGMMCFGIGCGPGLSHQGKWAASPEVGTTMLTSAEAPKMNIDKADPWSRPEALDKSDPWSADAPAAPPAPAPRTWGGDAPK